MSNLPNQNTLWNTNQGCWTELILLNYFNCCTPVCLPECKPQSFGVLFLQTESWQVSSWISSQSQFCCTEKSLKALKLQLNSVWKDEFTLKFQVLKLNRRWSDMLYFKRWYLARWTLGKLSAIILIWKNKVLLNEKKRTNARKIWAEFYVFLKPSASETCELCQILNKLRERKTLGISDCSSTHVAGKVQQHGYVSKEGACSPATTMKANQASSNQLFCELKIGDAYQWLTEPARFLPCSDKMKDKTVTSRWGESTSKAGTDDNSPSWG